MVENESIVPGASGVTINTGPGTPEDRGPKDPRTGDPRTRDL